MARPMPFAWLDRPLDGRFILTFLVLNCLACFSPAQDSSLPNHEGGQLTGQLLDCNDNAIPGVTLFIEQGRLRHEARSDVQGQFQFLNLRSRQVVQICLDPDTVPRNLALPWWQQEGQKSLILNDHVRPIGAEGKEQGLTLTLSPKHQLEGVILIQGLPYVGVVSLKGRFGPRGECWGPNYVFNTNPKGGFALNDLPEGLFEATLFSVDACGGNRGRVLARPKLADVVIGCSEAAQEVVLEPLPADQAATVTGFLHDQTGNPVTHMSLGIWERRTIEPEDFHHPLHHAAAAFQTGPDGRFEVQGLLPGEYFLLRTKSCRPYPEYRYRDTEPPLFFEVKENQILRSLNSEVHVFRPASLRGTLTGSGALRATDLKVAVEEKSSAALTRKLILRRVTAEEGFEVNDLLPGPLTLQVFASWTEGAHPLLTREIRLQDGESLDLVLELP